MDGEKTGAVDHPGSARPNNRSAGATTGRATPWVLVELAIFVLATRLWEITGLPRSVIPLFVFGWVSLRLRGLGWTAVGLRPPARWPHAIALGIGLGSLIQVLGRAVVFRLLTRHLGTPPLDPRDLSLPTDSLPLFLGFLVGQWVLASLGEEAVYRGYLLNRFNDLLGRGPCSTGVSVLLSSILFSVGHGLFGLPFLALNLTMGCVYAALYLASGRNLWLPIIAHATANTIGFTLAFIR